MRTFHTIIARSLQGNRFRMSSSVPPPAAGAAADSSRPSPLPRIVIVPGNGCGKIDRANWYRQVGNVLLSKGYDVRLESMPDPNEAKEKIWIPFIKETLQADEVQHTTHDTTSGNKQ